MCLLVHPPLGLVIHIFWSFSRKLSRIENLFTPSASLWEGINTEILWFHIQLWKNCQRAVTHWEGFKPDFLPNVFHEKVIILNSYVCRKHISTEFLRMYGFLPQVLPYEKVLKKKILDFTYNSEKNVRDLSPIEKVDHIFCLMFFMRR